MKHNPLSEDRSLQFFPYAPLEISIQPPSKIPPDVTSIKLMKADTNESNTAGYQGYANCDQLPRDRQNKW